MYFNHFHPRSGSAVEATALGHQIWWSPKPDCICAVTTTAALHLISIGLIYLVLINAIYSEMGLSAAVEFINRPLLDEEEE